MPHTQGTVYPTCHVRAAGSQGGESELLFTCPTPSRRTVVNPGKSKCTDWHLWFNVYMVFSSTKVADIGQQGKQVLLFICIRLDEWNDDFLCMRKTDGSSVFLLFSYVICFILCKLFLLYFTLYGIYVYIHIFVHTMEACNKDYYYYWYYYHYYY